MRIGINCGHTVDGQPGSGAVGYISESTETRKVGSKLMLFLSQAGHTVYDCTNNYAPSTNSNLSQIVNMANKQPLDLFVSIHFNSGGGKGTEVFTYGGKRHKEAVAACDNLHALGFVNRGVKDGSKLYVVRKTNAKAMLIEVCFVDAKTDVDLYKNIGAAGIASAIAKAITGQAITVQTEKNEEDIDMTKYEELTERIERLEISARANETDNSMIYNYIDKNMPEWAQEGVQWCVDKGIISGVNNNGELHLTYNKLWICTVMYRTAKAILKMVGVKI